MYMTWTACITALTSGATDHHLTNEQSVLGHLVPFLPAGFCSIR